VHNIRTRHTSRSLSYLTKVLCGFVHRREYRADSPGPGADQGGKGSANYELPRQTVGMKPTVGTPVGTTVGTTVGTGDY